MKTTFLKLKYFLIAGITILAFSCNPEEGPEGPMGSQGIQGEQGPAGLQGEQGEPGENGADGQDGQDGTDGNANVIASEWFGPEDETQVFDGNINYSEFEKAIENVNPTIMETATVIVFGRFDHYATNVWPTNHAAPLPITINFRTSSIHYSYFFSNNAIKIRYAVEPLLEFIFFPSTSQFRYVVIPASTTGKKNQPDFSLMTYREVMHYFSLEP